MIAQLTINDIVLIDALTLDFERGLTVLTGETGAGKSILLDAATLALGGRGDGALVRSGQKQGSVTAVFDLPADHPALTLAREAGFETEGELILRRVQMADGRTRGFVNDSPASAQVMRALGSALVEIHGQHADRALVDPAAHRALLDAFGGLTAKVSQLRDNHREKTLAAKAVAEEEARLAKARLDADYFEHAYAELSRLSPTAGEEEALATRRQQMMQAEKVAGDLKDAYDYIEGEASPIAGLASALRRLERRAGQAPALIEPSLAALSQALDALDHARDNLKNGLEAAAFDPQELERVEERLFALRGAARKYQCAVEDLPKIAENFAGRIEALKAGENRLAGLKTDAARAAARYDERARALSKARQAAAVKLDKAVQAELGPLKLERARFSTRIDVDWRQPTAEGYDRAEFWVETNPGSRPGPMMKVASGGELARFLLALKVALADKGSAPTLIFDEIDTGVGGAVADAIGARLARLAERVQVLAVTHAPQVAARAGNHWRIAKETLDKGSRVATRVTPLDPNARREEIARMLAGAAITQEARAAAARLLDCAHHEA